LRNSKNEAALEEAKKWEKLALNIKDKENTLRKLKRELKEVEKQLKLKQ